MMSRLRIAVVCVSCFVSSACVPSLPLYAEMLKGSLSTPSSPALTASPIADYDYHIGAPSTFDAAQAEILRGAQAQQNYVSPSGRSYRSLRQAHSILNDADTFPISTRDTGAAQQWSSGWTGRGVDIGVLDFFTENQRIDDHGNYVALVLNGVAPEANLVLHNHVETDQLARAAWQALDQRGVHITNNSWGYDKAERRANGVYTGNIVANFDRDVAEAVAYGVKITGNYSYHADALFIFAAGNGGGHCGDSYHIDKCNYHAAVTAGLRGAGIPDNDAMLWVGALTDDGTEIAPYSYHGGALKNDFIVAHDDVLTLGDASGTSYAAPRVAGAAALLKHKFPNLNGNEIKTVLLYTAQDMGALGVDEVYGWGKLDLDNAISPQGYLRPGPLPPINSALARTNHSASLVIIEAPEDARPLTPFAKNP